MRFTERITDPRSIDKARIAEILATGKTATIQFSAPPYADSVLPEIDSLCERYGSDVEVRFFGHYSSRFDASALAHLPNVQALSIDCLRDASQLEYLFELRHLRILSIGIYEMNMPDILSRIRISQLTDLALCETRRGTFDLAPLAACRELSNLSLASPFVGAAVLEQLNLLSDLRLRGTSKKQSLEFVSKIPNLKMLELILGGRPDINEIEHPTLQELRVIRVLGFRELGDLGRFPSLTRLRVEDQLQLAAVNLTNASADLTDLALCNCKNLRSVGPLGHLSKLQQIAVGVTNVEFEELFAPPLPVSLRIARFWTRKKKLDAVYRARLDALGLAEFTWSRKTGSELKS